MENQLLISPIQNSPGIAMRLTHYEFIWLQSGDGRLIVDMDEYVLEKHRLYLLAPGQVRSVTIENVAAGFQLRVTPDWLLALCARNETNLIPYRPMGSVPLIVDIACTDIPEVEDILGRMLKCSADTGKTGTKIVKGLFGIFLLYVSRNQPDQYQQTQNKKDGELVHRFLLMLSNDFATRKQVADYAAGLFVTPGYLNVIVKKISGFTASYFIRQRVILEAKRQAVQSGKSMKEIAYNLGFDDSAHFSKFFKNSSGLNFTTYKKMICS